MRMSRAFATALVLISLMIGCWQPKLSYAQDHLKATYVAWGTDEFEFFNLTQPELQKQFGKDIAFDFSTDISYARLNRNNTNGPQFLLTFANGKVATVERMFIDGGGCKIMGPLFKSQKDALKFSIDGLTKLSGKVPKEEEKLSTAQKLLQAIERPSASIDGSRH